MLRVALKSVEFYPIYFHATVMCSANGIFNYLILKRSNLIRAKPKVLYKLNLQYIYHSSMFLYYTYYTIKLIIRVLDKHVLQVLVSRIKQLITQNPFEGPIS